MSQALALSCHRPNAVHHYAAAAASEHDYMVVRGHFADTSALSLPNAETVQTTIGSILFTGYSLTKSGFTAPFAQSITIHLTCAGPWCAVRPPETPVIAFFERRQDGLHLDYGPCGWWITKDSAPDRKALLACHRTGTCTSVYD